jgi:hypothetical protein
MLLLGGIQLGDGARVGGGAVYPLPLILFALICEATGWKTRGPARRIRWVVVRPSD